MGGALVCEGTLADITAAPESITGQCLKSPMPHSGKVRHPIRKGDLSLQTSGAVKHNLKNITAKIPLGKLVALTGVSGSGKSTLARDVLLPLLKMRLSKTPRAHSVAHFGCKAITGWDSVNRVLEVDQTPIGKTPSSVSYTHLTLPTNSRV